MCYDRISPYQSQLEKRAEELAHVEEVFLDQKPDVRIQDIIEICGEEMIAEQLFEANHERMTDRWAGN